MQPQLHATVSAVATPEGLLFRMGEAFLPIDGRGTAASFRRLAPFLDGRWSVRALTQAAPRPQRRALVRLLRALRDAGMLFDATKAMSAPEAPRLLVIGPSTLARLVQAPLRGVQPRQLAFVGGEHDEAAIDVGLLDEVAVDQTAADRVAADEARRSFERAVSGVDPSVLAASDVVVLIGRLPEDREWLVEAERACERAAHERGGSTPAIAPLVVTAGHVLVGPIVAADAVRRVRDLLDESRLDWSALERSAPEQSASERSTAARSAAEGARVSAPAIAIGANLLARKIADAHAGRVPRDERHVLHDVDAATLEIRARPLPLPLPARVSLDRLRESDEANGRVAPAARERRRARSSEAEDWRLLDRLNRLLVDPVTGLLARLEEEELGQIPHHQSSALWRPPLCETPARTTDAGANILESRVAVARLVLEAYLLDACCHDAHRHDVHCHGRDRQDASLPAHAIVASAMDETMLRAEAWFKALASAAEARGDWSDMTFDAARHACDGEAALTFGYLADIGEADAIQVARCESLAAAARGELLQFSHHGRPVSIVAGPRGAACWTVGLRDIWLDVTARRAFGEASPLWPRLRHRSAFAASGLRASEIVATGPWRFEPLIWPERDLLDPLRFAVASIID